MRDRAGRNFGLRALTCVATLLLAHGAGAQTGPSSRFALDSFEPAPAGDRFFGFDSPELLGHLAFDMSFVTVMGLRPLTLRSADDESVAIVPVQVVAHTGLALTLWSRWKVSLDVPFGITAVDEDVAAPTGSAPPDGGFGDLRAGLRLRLGGEPGDVFRAAIAGYAWAPTGDEAAFAGDGTARGGPALVLGGKVTRGVTWGTSGGFVFRRERQFAGATIGPALTFGAGLAASLGRSDLIVETGGKLGTSEDLLAKATTNVELLVGYRRRADDLVVAIGSAFGLSKGVGTPLARLVVSFAYAPLERPSEPEEPWEAAPPAPDRDGDGIVDRDDACPDETGYLRSDPATYGCPDADGDGLLDRADACPNEAGAIDPLSSTSGCPPVDSDHDGVVDADDACPNEAGPPSEVPMDSGCPRDSDFDGIVDGEDACMHQKGVLALEPAVNGCPREPGAAP